MIISIQNRQKRLPHLSRSLRRRAKAILHSLNLENVEVSVVLCDDPTIQELNREWRNIDKPTDVLSFPQEDFDAPVVFDEEEELTQTEHEMLGDIVISIDTCIRQAEEWNHTPLDEATRLWVHGLLHLCGYDHETPEEAQEMLAKEEEILKQFKRRTIRPLVQI